MKEIIQEYRAQRLTDMVEIVGLLSSSCSCHSIANASLHLSVFCLSLTLWGLPLPQEQTLMTGVSKGLKEEKWGAVKAVVSDEIVQSTE